MTTRALVPIPRTAIVPAAGLGTRFPPCYQDGPQGAVARRRHPPASNWSPPRQPKRARSGSSSSPREGKDGVVAHFVEGPHPRRHAGGPRQASDAGEGAPRARAHQGRIRRAERTAGPRPRRELRRVDPVARRGRRRGAAAPTIWCCRRACSRPCRRCGAKRGGSVLCAIEVPADEISAYGVFDVRGGARRRELQMCCGSGGWSRSPRPRTRRRCTPAAGPLRAGPGHLRRAAAGAAGGGRRDSADRCDRPADRGGPHRSTSSCTAGADTTLGKSRRLPQGCG